MAYVGTPIDTTNTFTSLQGKRFDGDGSTTDFTLDVAPSSTLDIEVFVGNVRQDPNSAYTISGTTLSFTGAPPTGTNNIYVVHQAKAVGTIDVPTGGVVAGSLGSGVLTGQTDIGGDISEADLFLIDDGAGGTLRKTAASRIKTYASGLDGVTTGSGNVTITDGDLIVASGHGISFAATGDGSGSMVNELLDDYEEGTWTPTFRNYGGTDQNASGEYTKIGELVIAGGRIGTDGTSDSSTIEIAGLHFTISNDPAINGHGGANVNFTTGLAGHLYQTVNNTSYIQANSNVGAGMNYNDFGANKEVRFTIIYKVA